MIMAQQPVNDEKEQGKNEEKPLSKDAPSDKEARINWMKTWFKEADKDKNNYLDRNECEDVILKFGFSNHKDALFAKFDDNADGKVTLDEFVSALDKILKMKEDKISWISNIFNMFQLYDANKDGKITKDEWDKALFNQGLEQDAKDTFWKEALKMDKNNDGKLTFGDFIRYTDSLESSS